MLLTDILERDLHGITLLYGPASTGKTTLALRALRGRSIYVSTHKNFNVERLLKMRSDAPDIINQLVLFEPTDLASLEKAIDTAVKLSAMSQLLVVDSLATFVRASDRKLGNLALHRMLQKLATASCPVLLTSEVYERAEGMYAVEFVGGDMLRVASSTIIELSEGTITVKKDALHAGRFWQYRITDQGLEKI